MALRHVGVNAVFLRPRFGGLETYLKQLVAGLLRERPGLRVSVFVSPEGLEVLRDEPWAGDVRLVAHPLLGGRGLKAVSEATLLGALAPRRGVDLLHSLALTGPLRTRAAHVLTVADVVWLYGADSDARATFLLWRALVPPTARRADRVLAISRDGAREIAERLGVVRERIDVVYLGFGLGPRAAPTPEAELRARLGLGPGPLVLTVSQKRAHKNLLRLVRAMARVRERVPDAVLALPGNPTAHERELRAEVARLGLGDAVAFPAYVAREELEGLYAAAACSVTASTREGFGLPVLEAQARGVPVACSRASALPEAAGPGARYFDPHDEADIAAAIVELLVDRELAGRLVAAGREHAAGFTWQRTAQGTLESYERALAGRR
jgi:glycosyltransferase involved in cell wall biosynthesis